MTLTLYYAPGACSLVPHVALEEAGATFEAVRLDLAKGIQRSAEYLAINPRGRVPALATGERVISENIAILTYLALKFPNAGLLPTNPEAAAAAYEWMAWLASTAHVTIAQIFRPGRFTTDAAAAAVIQAEGRVSILGHLQTMDAALTGAWVLGRDFSVLDPYFLVFWRWGERLELDMSAYPNLRDHAERVRARPSAARALAREAAA